MKIEYKSLAVKAAIWTGIFLFEAVFAWWDSMSSPALGFWRHFLNGFLLQTLPFLVLFTIHDLLLAPMLSSGRRISLYILCTAALMGVFSVYILGSEGMLKADKHPEPIGQMHRTSGQTPPPPPDGSLDRQGNHPELRPGGHPKPEHDKRPIGASVSKIIIAFMLLGVNLGAKYYKNYVRERQRLEEVEKENLRYRLEYLRYQINPHFFMNTLNNIHALVDVSPEKAKDSIVELSRLMRHVLYDSNGPTVALSKELDFLRHYLYLMRLRYTDNVRIEYTFPDDDGGAQVPPLLMATVTENAFKHGISYKSDSYIVLSVSLKSGRIVFRCTNSLCPEQDGQTIGGIGLDNIQKRLSLLYGKDFVMDIDKSESRYEVLMILPSRPTSEVDMSNHKSSYSS